MNAWRWLNSCGLSTRATIPLPTDFKEFLQLLNSERVEYLLIGGYAVFYYGYPRATGDMDIWVGSNRANAEKLVAALRKFGFEDASLTPDVFTKEHQILRMGVPPLRIALLTTISGVDFSTGYALRNVVVWDGVAVNIIGLEQLKANKRASGRNKDKNDLENLP